MQKKLLFFICVALAAGAFIFAGTAQVKRVQAPVVQTIEIPATKGESAFEATMRFASSTRLDVVTSYHQDLGYFVEELGGVKNANGKYWTLYINGAYSALGASNARLTEGDVVTWKYESL